MAGYPTYHVNVFTLKSEIIWTGGLPNLSGLPHLSGVPHLHVNRPLIVNFVQITKHVEFHLCENLCSSFP